MRPFMTAIQASAMTEEADYMQKAVEVLMRVRVAETFGSQYDTLHSWPKFLRDRPADASLYREKAWQDVKAAEPFIAEHYRGRQQAIIEEIEEKFNQARVNYAVEIARVEAERDEVEEEFDLLTAAIDQLESELQGCKEGL
jgi:hypothetical protein